MSGIIIDHEKCILCRKCLRSCPVSALELIDGRIRVTDLCNLCTMCVDSCPKGAIAMKTAEAAASDSSGIWIYAQFDDSGLCKVSCELASKAAELAGETEAVSERTCEVTALLPCNDRNMAEQLVSCGADRVLFCEKEALKDGDPDAAAAWVVSLVRERQPAVMLFPATAAGREIAPACAAMLGTGLTADCTALEIDPESGLLHQTRPAFGGNLMATIICPGTRPQMATVREGVFSVRRIEPGDGCPVPGFEEPGSRMEATDFPDSFIARRSMRKVLQAAGDAYDVTKAEKLVVVGRGIESKKNIPLMREFADRIGAGFGCSRPLVEAGWCEYPHQVGQTGHSVAPKLLISIGVSGAIQHLAGIAGAEKIIAINTDEKAPIFGVADCGIVGDCVSVVKEFLKS
ncbi:MAG: FAD-binding protein [Lachnospiraceae bacterium]|nr:FAD-binding protein [Lachnospiraceae bacterium]